MDRRLALSEALELYRTVSKPKKSQKDSEFFFDSGNMSHHGHCMSTQCMEEGIQALPKARDGSSDWPNDGNAQPLSPTEPGRCSLGTQMPLARCRCSAPQ